MKHNLLKSVIISVILLLGANSVYGAYKGSSSGFWENDGLKITFNINGTTSEKSLNYASPATTELGEVTTSLKLTKTLINFWTNYGTSAKSSTVYWELYNGNTKIGNTYERTTSAAGDYTGSNSTYTVTTETDILALTTGPGNYTIKVWAKFTSSEGEYWYNMNNNSNYSFTFTINPIVTFKANGGTDSDKTQRVTYNTNTALNANTFTKTGYTFTGWNTKADGTGTGYSDGATVKFTANQTLYAQWEIREDKIVLWANNGSFGKNASGGKITEYELYIQYGTNTFYTKDDQGNKTYVTAPMPSYSIRKYCRGFYFGGDTAKLVIDKYGKLCKGVVNGYRYTDDNGNWVYTGNNTQTTVTAWYSDKYPVELDANSGIWTSTGRKVTYVVYDTEELVPDITGGSSSLPWKTGYTFDGYYVNADGTGDKYYDKDGKGLKPWTFFSTDTDIIEKLYANYELAVYNITYDNLGDATHTNPATYTIETPTISFSAPTKSRTGYTFKNWNPSSIAKGSTNNKTITAQWTANTYTVSFDQQSGTGGTASVTATFDAAMPTISTPTRTGYTFGGYYSEKNGGGTQYYKADGTSANIWNKTVATTLYAKWNANSYTVQFNANGGIGSMANQAFTYDAAQNLSTNTFTRTGYTFAGWNTNADGTGTSYTNSQSVRNLTAVNNGIVTLYAKWTANTYTVTLDPQGGTGSSSTTNATFNAVMQSITPPTRDGYIFDGYYSESNGQGKKYYNADGSSANNWDKENATLYAKWVEYAKCIFFKNNLNWTNIYVYTFKGDVWGNDGKGVYPANRHEYGTMTKIGDTDVYYYILNESNEFNYIAFSDYDMSSYTPFWGYNAVYRGDHVPGMQLFIPQQSQSSSSVNESTTKYYNEGVWMKYNSTESGYYLNISGESSTQFTTQTAGGYDFSTTIYLTGNETKTIDITNICPNTKFSKTQTTSNSGEWTLDQWGDFNAASTWNFTSSITGPYTFNISIETGQVKVKAIYPTLVEPETGDYRLIYIEQVVEKSTDENQEWKTVHTLKKLHPSDIIKRRTISGVDTVSLHVYNGRTYQAVKNPKAINDQDKYYSSSSNSEVILQRYNGSSWENKERHMVFGPLETLPSMAMLPGRRNTEGNTTLKYDKGIKVIQEDEKNSGNGVWNFPIAQTVNGSEVTATLERSGIKRYSGKYYIRTANSVGGWNNYTIPENHMTHSLYAESNNEFTHYYCKWIDINKGSRYVQFVVANDFGQAISDTLVADRATLFGVALAEGERMVSDNGLLPASANVRFSWKEDNNALHRAYIDGSGSSKEYLVLKDLDKKLFKFNSNANNLTNDTVTFLDNGGWMYQVDVYSKTNSPINLTAKYNGKVQHFKGEAARATTNLIGGNQEDATKYPIRILYDFKENHLITGYVPQVPETKDVTIETNLMMIRKNHEAANQLTMNINNVGEDGVAVNTGYDAYGVLTFTEDHLKGTDNWKVTNDKTFYWISFPFDVNLKDAFGFGKYAYHWYIEYYDGASRAENGLFLDSGTYWEYVMEEDADNFVLYANQGYVLWLNVAQIQADGFFTAITKEISIYFPSANKIANNFQTKSETITLEPLLRPEGSRRYTQDSNWRLIGVPSYANTAATTTQGDINFVYVYDAATNKYNVTKTINDLSGNCFQSMHAYMIQYAGDINWTTVVNEYPISQLAAKQNTDSEKDQHVLRLELQRNGNREDHTYIQLQNEGATNMFDMNLDLTKMTGSGGNIYSIIPSASDPIQAAANVMPIEEYIIPLGVKTTKATNYTFAMPDGTDGIVVELIDYEANTRTNMLLDDYTVTLPKGTNDTRFALHVKPNKVVTDVENITSGSDSQVRKLLIDGVLYMQKDGVLYDAQGKLVR